jgi:hypothetical protein
LTRRRARVTGGAMKLATDSLPFTFDSGPADRPRWIETRPGLPYFLTEDGRRLDPDRAERRDRLGRAERPVPAP